MGGSGMSEEMWLKVLGFEHLVSNFGRVSNAKATDVLKPIVSGWGYLQVRLYKDGRHYTKSIHILVAEKFVPGWDYGLKANHIDGDKWNNHDYNLEWVTKGDDLRHAHRSGLNPGRGKTIRVVETGEVFRSTRECARVLGLHESGIWSVLHNKRPHTRGFSFEFVD